MNLKEEMRSQKGEKGWNDINTVLKWNSPKKNQNNNLIFWPESTVIKNILSIFQALSSVSRAQRPKQLLIKAV